MTTAKDEALRFRKDGKIFDFVIAAGGAPLPPAFRIGSRVDMRNNPTGGRDAWTLVCDGSSVDVWGYFRLPLT